MNIRNVLIAAASAVTLASMATGALAAGTATATAPASVTVLSPVSLTKTQNMVFGSVIRPSSVGTSTVAMDANGAITVTNTGGGNGSAIAGTTTAAKFDLTAQAGITYTTTQTLAFTQAGLTSISASAPVATTGTLGTIPGGGGTQELRFGGQFDMTSATTAQGYTGTLSVTVNYN